MIRAAVFLASFVYFFSLPFHGVSQMIGDNVCQISYWRVLFRPELAGSFGPATLKPGLMLLLGPTFELSRLLFRSDVLLRLLFSAFGALLVSGVVFVAAKASGWVGGFLAGVLLLTDRTVTDAMVLPASSMLFFAPTLLFAIYFYGTRRKGRGNLLYFFATLFRLEAVAAHFLHALASFAEDREVRPLLASAATMALAVGTYFLSTYLVAGDVRRLDLGATGYVLNPEGWQGLAAGLRFTAQSVLHYAALDTSPLFEGWGPPLTRLTLLPFIAFAALGPGTARRFLLVLAGIPLFLNLYWALGGCQRVRYFEFVLPAAVALGAAGMGRLLASAARFVRDDAARGAVLALCLALLTTGLLRAELSHRNEIRSAKFEKPGPEEKADALISRISGGPNHRILVEDDVACFLEISDSRFLGPSVALQYFNVQNDRRRAEILRRVDYLFASKTRENDYYYLGYLPLPAWREDPFRKKVTALAEGSGGVTAYGCRFSPVENAATYLLARVDGCDPLE